MTGGRATVFAGTILVIGAAIVLLVLIRRDPDRDPTPTASAPSPQRARRVADPPPVDGHVDASRERDQLFARVRTSGRGDEPWNAQAGDVFAAIAHLGARVDPIGCYVAGCAATLELAAGSDYRRFVSALDGSDAYRAWTGGKQLSEAEIGADGSITLGLVLYRPD